MYSYLEIFKILTNCQSYSCLAEVSEVLLYLKDTGCFNYNPMLMLSLGSMVAERLQQLDYEKGANN